MKWVWHVGGCSAAVFGVWMGLSAALAVPEPTTVVGVAAAPAPAPESAAPAAAPAPPAAHPGAPLILIDPGHGGTNSGAASVDETVLEKHLTLALSFAVRDELTTRGYRVELTRDRDVYLTLRQRADRANAIGCDAFVSIHGNATDAHTQRGYETYILTAEALDVDGRALRRSGGTPRPVAPELGALLDDVERGTAHRGAAELARAIQDQLRQARGPSGDRGVRQASMHVLLGATMPAVLVEVGFIDHPDEGPEILAAKTRARIATAIADGIADAVPTPAQRVE